MARSKEIEIDTRLGRRIIRTDKIVRFPRGLAGFENERDFTLLQIVPDAPLLILQSVNLPQVGLLVADPYSFLDKSYAPVVSEAELRILHLQSLEQAAILLTVSIPSGKPEEAVLNLTGPIIINHEACLGLQVPQTMEGVQQVSMHACKPAQGEDAPQNSSPPQS